MLKFFKNIRLRMLQSNKAKSYALYGIGEIALVVIGILIALQINNWNEGQKAKVFEHKILTDIKNSMRQNIWTLQRMTKWNNNSVISGEIVLKHMRKNLPYHDSLDMHFSRAISFSTSEIRNAGYESLKSYGIHVISNDSIRNALSIYNNDWISILANRQEAYFFNTASPILTSLFETVAMRAEMKPFDYEKLKKSDQFRSIINTSIAYRRDQIFWYNRWVDQLLIIEKAIDKELGTEKKNTK